MRRDRKLSGVRLVGLVLTLQLAASSIPPVAAGLHNDSRRPVVQAQTQEGQTPLPAEVAGVNADWWSTVQEDIRRSEYQITWQEQTYLDDVPAAYQAPNRAQNLRTYFTPQGPIVIPRTWAKETAVPPWRWGVRLAAWGREGASQTVPPADLTVEENQIEYRRGGQDLIEWYGNDEEGLEQGFRLLAAPEGRQTEQPLRLDLALSGDLIPEMVHEGAEIEFRSPDGSGGLRYGALRAEDATGEPLTAWLVLQNSTLVIWIEDAEAEYPIRVEASIRGLPPDADWARTFGQSEAEFGASVATAGDVDGNGYSEVIIGAPNYDAGLGEEGGVFVYHGSSGGLYEFSDWYKVFDQGGANFGYSVATAGDVNGDGYADIIVGAPGYTNGAGQEGEGGTWVYHGSAEGLEDDWSTHDESNQAGAAFGASVATAGDVNGDGYADVIVGAPLFHNGESEEGMVWVWHGSADGLSETHNWHAEANLVNASFGQSVATAGDVNRDGYADIIVGATRYTAGESWEGAAFVWLGSALGVNGNVDGTPANEHRHLQIDQASARFGWSVSTAGDVNGDGYADVIVGAPYYTNGQGHEGGAWLYLGSGSGLSATSSNQDEGNQANAHFGWSVATAGDVNGDGRADVIVGAPGYRVSLDQQGRAWLWYGQSTSAGISTTSDWRAAGEQTEAFFGESVATAGDVNGDGYSDVIVGAPGHASAAGRCSVYHGGSDPLAVEAGWTKRSNQENALFGTSVGTAGDVNGDGYADVIVGAPRWDGGQENEGAAWVYLGQATGLTSAPHWYRRSNNPGAEFGASVGTAGDVNGDGYDDVIVGAPLWHVPETNEGVAFVYQGSSSGLSETAPPLWNKASNQAGAEFGTSVGTAGDVNGDGYADIIVGAPFWQSGGQERGAVWLYYGSSGGPHSAPDWYTVGDQANAQYGHAVGTAGDVNGDGYSDVIVGAPYWEDEAPNVNEGRAWVYLGSSAGLRYDLHWHAEGNNYIARLGHAVGTAGDVDGDGYSDVIVGAPGYGDGGLSQEGKVWVFHGSSGGLEASSAWSREGGQDGAHYGWSVSTAGDVNGDGYADVIIGIELWNGGLTNEGGASVYHGSFGGLGDSLTWHGEGDQASAHYGTSVGTAGDVNGDGYADVIVGAPNYNQAYPDEGQVFLYYGNGGPGVSLRLRQFKTSGTPLARLGHSDGNGFRMGLRYANPFGRGELRVEIETKPLGQQFTGSDTFIPGGPVGWIDAVPGDGSTMMSGPLSFGMNYHWRMRFRYNPGTTPFLPVSRWVTIPWNGWNETDLRTAGSRVTLPLVVRDYE